MNRIVFVAVALAVFAKCASAQQSPLSLEDAFRRALRSHPSVARAEHLAGAVRARIGQAEAGMMPNIAIQGSITNGPLGAPALGLQGLAGDPIKKHYGSSLNIIQPIYDFGKTAHLAASRRDSYSAANQDTAALDAQVLLAVEQAYVQVLRHQQLVGVYRENVRQRETTARQAQLLADSGLKADVDAQLAKANLADARGALLSAENELQTAFAALNNAMGETALTTYRLDTAPFNRPTATGPADQQMKLALEQRPELKSAALQVDASEQAIKSARSELMPQFSGIASAGAITPSKLITRNEPYAIGVAVTFPLYTGGNVEGRIAEEKQRREAIASGLRELQELVKLQVTRAVLDVQTRTAQIIAAREQVTAADSARQQAAERYRLQLSSVVELTDAEAASTRAHANLVNAENDLELARAALDWATGTTYRRYVPVKRR